MELIALSLGGVVATSFLDLSEFVKYRGTSRYFGEPASP
jgi:hypothetical protein